MEKNEQTSLLNSKAAEMLSMYVTEKILRVPVGYP